MRRIEFLTQDDPLYILPLFTELLRGYSAEMEVTQVSCCRTMGGRSRGRLFKETLLLYRPLGFCRVAARLAAAKLFSLYPASRGAGRYWSIHQVCRAYGVPFRQIGSPNDESYIQGLRDRRPELLVSVACPYILKRSVLQVAPLGCINIHHARLPRYKGMMPTFWQLYNGERQVGLTVHYVNEKIDEGEPVLQETIPIEPGESLDHLIRRTKQVGAHCLGRVLRDLPPPRRTAAAAAEEGSYFTFPTAQQIREFHRKGLRAI